MRDPLSGKCFNCGSLDNTPHQDWCSDQQRADAKALGYEPFDTCPLCGVKPGEMHADSCPIWKDVAEQVGIAGHTIVTAIPPEVVQYKDDIRRFVDAMVYKLQVHAKKGRWENMPIEKALELMKGEEAELTEAVERGNLVEILLESADVANYALIVASIAVERGK